MKNTVEFAFDIGDEVCVSASPDIKAHVIGLTKKSDGLLYYIVWWDSGKRIDEWVQSWEIEEVK